MKFDKKEYFIIFDTNVLFQNYDKRADFSTFRFNTTYHNVVDMIEQYDIYEHVILAIPVVVWNEMKKQIITAHDKNLNEFREKINKMNFPEIHVEENDIGDYADFIQRQIDIYKTILQDDMCEVIELPIANERRFQSIVNRAFEKRPPFLGENKVSDKGFKDALLWESILDFTSKHEKADIIFYTKDNGFKNDLTVEFAQYFPDASVTICSNEDEIKTKLELIAKEIDEYAYIPESEPNEFESLLVWLKSEEFVDELMNYPLDFIEEHHLLRHTKTMLNQIGEIYYSSETEDKTYYTVNADLDIYYLMGEKETIVETISVQIEVECLLDEAYFIDYIYKDNFQE